MNATEIKSTTVRDFFVGFYRLIVGGSLVFIACTVILWSDRHNDERYVKQLDLKGNLTDVGDERWIKKDQYLENKELVTRELASIKQQAERNSASNEQKLDSIQRDIKDILWRMGGTDPKDHLR